MRLIFFLCLGCILFACSESPQTKESFKPKQHAPKIKKQQLVQTSAPKSSRYTVATFSQPEGWGYYICENGKQIINQKSIPGVPGNQGFSSSEEALKVAELVRTKIENGTFPPTISEEELQKLGISWRN